MKGWWLGFGYKRSVVIDLTSTRSLVVVSLALVWFRTTFVMCVLKFAITRSMNC